MVKLSHLIEEHPSFPFHVLLVLIGFYSIIDVTCSIWAYLSFKCIEATKRVIDKMLQVIAVRYFIPSIFVAQTWITKTDDEYAYNVHSYGVLNVYLMPSLPRS